MTAAHVSDPYERITDILPRLAINAGWLKLIGEARIEQSSRQVKRTKRTPVSAEQAAYMARKQAARRHNRRGTKAFLAALAVA